MDKSTLGSSAILGIQYGSKYISRCPVSKIKCIVGKPRILPLTSASLQLFSYNVFPIETPS